MSNKPSKSAQGWVRFNEKREQRKFMSRTLAAQAGGRGVLGRAGQRGVR